MQLIATDADICASLGIRAPIPDRDDVIIGMGGVLDLWPETFREVIEADREEVFSGAA